MTKKPKTEKCPCWGQKNEWCPCNGSNSLSIHPQIMGHCIKCGGQLDVAYVNGTGKVTESPDIVPVETPNPNSLGNVSTTLDKRIDELSPWDLKSQTGAGFKLAIKQLISDVLDEVTPLPTGKEMPDNWVVNEFNQRRKDLGV